MTITVTLGDRYADIEGVRRPRALVIDEHPTEIDPEVIFQACNRIEDAVDDCRNLPDWAQLLRRGIDIADATSMSGGDHIFVTANSGHELGGWRCDSIGWTVVRGRDRQAHTNGHHVFFLEGAPT